MSSSDLNNPSKHIRLFILAFGAGVGIYIFSAIYSGISNTIRQNTQDSVQIVNASLSNDNTAFINIAESQKQRLKIHHNFIVSILYQESSFERKLKHEEAQDDFIGNMRVLHKVVLSQGLALF